jgi:hypothetical protein
MIYTTNAVEALHRVFAQDHQELKTLRTAGFAKVLRGVSFTPGTDHDRDDRDHDRHADAD